MAKPTRHYDMWRIRWFDEHGARQSAVYDDYKTACHELRQRELETEERRLGARRSRKRRPASRRRSSFASRATTFPR